MTDGLVKYVDAASRLDWGPVCTPVHSGLMTKLASECHTPDALLKVIESLRERPEGVYVLITALGAYEYWGVNRNGDAFPEWSLKGLPPPADVAEYLAGAKFREKYGPFSVPTGRYGHATFVTDAKAYILHVNSDPTRSVGDVIASAYNEHMHRVELVLFIYEARDPDGVRMLREGRPTPFSMGAKLPFDACSICLNPARNRTQYCEHLRTQMNQILPDGRKVFTFNWFPRYFDISRVRVPADPSAWALRKVAGVGTSDVAHAPRILVPVGTGLTKVAGLLGKTGTLTKETPPTVAKPLGSAPIDPDLLSLVRAQVAADDAPELRDEALEAAGRTDGFGALLTALATAGIVLRPSEFSRMQAASGEKMPARLDAQVPSLRLLMLVRRHVPQRSMVEPEFSERRKTASVPARPTTAIAAARDDDGYARYLACLRDVVDDVVKIAERPDVRIRLRPDWAGRMLFKQAGHPAGPTAWLPFLVSLVPTVR